MTEKSIETVIVEAFIKAKAKWEQGDAALRKQLLDLNQRIARLEGKSQSASTRPVRALGLRRNSR